MSDQQFTLEAVVREDIGKGASRRLRREQGLVPAVVYGGKKKPQTISLYHNKVIRALEEEAFYSSVIAISVDGKSESVILKDLQRHPYKQQILHMDLQRVSQSEEITKQIPLHFINEDTSVGVKAGGQVSHSLTELEITCKVKDLPSFIEIDLAEVELEQVLHITDVKLPKGVRLAHEITDSAHDHPVVSIHEPKAQAVEEPVEAADAGDSTEEAAGDAASDEGKDA